ncbi:MAG: pyruvate dehydrogenase (acetyl-transferring) E1 component subunit alpha [Alphaproteobacteria bacterium]|nr:pyruvate dehydrogenase (acetyl-transferring) E1 component subunit alpha [Alphaproteobacteria bacterium]
MAENTQGVQPHIVCHRCLGPDGQPCHSWPDFAERPEALIELYRAMVLTRTFDAKAVALQRTGRLGTFASSLGQEAVAVGVGAAMRPEDVLLPSFREQGAQFIRGVGMVEILQYWGGDERGSDFAGPREDFPICVPVGTHAPHAAGVALAMKLRGEDRAAVCVMGDGATSKGDVYEAMNLAGVWRLPVVFVVNNNQWAISVPRNRQTAAKTLAQKAVAAGFPGEQVDGNDVIAVRYAVEQGLERARTQGEPTLIEALTYRLSDHTTVDDASRYRDDAEVSAHWKDEPVVRLRTYLVDAGHWDKAREDTLIAECNRQVEQAADQYLGMQPQPPEAMFDHLYAVLPPSLIEQRDAMLAAARDREPGDG